MTNLLLTGAAGGVATMLRPLLKDHADHVRLSDRVAVSDLAAHESFEMVDLTDLAACEKLAEGVDGIIHLGGFSVEGDWDTIHEANITGCYNMIEAAKRQKVERFVFASSNHAIGFYRREQRISTDQRVRPDGYYGVSKAFGEALASLYADKYGMRCLSIRIGNVDYQPVDERRLSIWLHPEDLMQLIQIGLTHPDLHNEVVYGASDNLRGWWDNHTAYALGYKPKHQSEDHLADAMTAQSRLAADPIADQFQGGGFCSGGFTGKLDVI